jgi:hypothetical protein
MRSASDVARISRDPSPWYARRAMVRGASAWRTTARIGFILAPLTGCQEESPPPQAPGSQANGLEGCLADAIETNANDDAVARCEASHYGTEWRKDPMRTRSDATIARTGTGNLDPQLINAGIHARFRRFRACYVAGLKRNNALAGEVRVKFVIDDRGHATNVEDAGSRIKDKQVVSCIVGEFGALRFPKPEGGTVTVVYPMVFGAGDAHL